MSNNVLRTAPSVCVAAVMDAVAKHSGAAVAIDDDGGLHVFNTSATAQQYAENHPHLTVTTYTNTIRPSDVLSDIAARISELAVYGQDRQRRHR